MIFLTEKENKTLSIIDNSSEIDEKQFFSYILKAPIVDKFYQIACGFDIETSSFRDKDDNKRGTMYIWQMSFSYQSGTILYVYGRTWTEWEHIIFEIKRKLNLKKYKMIFYVHNLAFEFHWIFTHIYLTKVFARKKRHPIYIESDNLIFKCSYFLSNLSLRNLAKEHGYTLKEEMDYSLLRLSCTPLTKDELNYSLTDVKIIAEYILDEINKNGNIKNIPLTSTGYARRYCLDYIKEHENIISYQKWLKSILPLDKELFTLLYQGYTGAFTHANIDHVNISCFNVHCIDFTSSYPAVMCRKRFPMAFHKADPTKLRFYKGKAQIMKITFHEIKASTSHSIISRHKSVIDEDTNFKTIIDNGRVRQAYSLTTVITDLDFEIYEKFYTWKSYQIDTIYIADYRYLPRNLIIAILELYKNKTTLKGVLGKEDIYLNAKALINAIYGMSVTNPINDDINFDYDLSEWISIETDIDAGLTKYKNNRNLFTAYQWGVWVTAWARWELLMTLYEFGNDGIYCDTDSIKYFNNHDDTIEKVNKRIINENKAVIKYYNIDAELYSPKTLKGEIKTLGLWDREHDYYEFKTLGAKRYAFSYEDTYFEKLSKELKTEYNFFITVAGLSKENGRQAIIKKAINENKSPFDIFSYQEGEELCISSDETGKSSFSYQIGTFSCKVTDYLGNSMIVTEYSYVNAESIPFEFNYTDDYAELLGLKSTYTNMTGSFHESRMRIRRK